MKIRQRLKRLDSYINRVTGLGTSGDKGRSAEIAPSEPLDDTALEDLYRNNAYAGVIVDELVQEATRKGWTVQSDTPVAGLDQRDLMSDWDDDWELRDKVAWAATLGRLLGGAVLMLVVNDGRQPSDPFDPERPYTLLNLVVLDRREVFVQDWETDITNRNFGRPKSWRIQPSVNGVVQGMDAVNVVDDSRMVYFPGRRVSRRVRVNQRGFDDSVLRRALDAVRNKTSNDQARATIIQDFKTDVLKTKNLDGIGTADAQLDYFSDRMEVLARGRSNVNLILLDEGEEFQKTTTSVAGLADLDSASTEELTTAARMPRTRFTGEAPGGLNTDGESQTKNWSSQVASYQTDILRPQLTRLYRVILGATNGPTDGKIPPRWSIVFNALEEPTEHQQAALRKTTAETDALYLDRGVIDPAQVAEGRFGRDGWRLDLPALELEELDIPEADVPAAATSASASDVQKTALNGAQVASMLQIVQSANEGVITPEQAANIIARAFQLAPDAAKALVKQEVQTTAPAAPGVDDGP